VSSLLGKETVATKKVLMLSIKSDIPMKQFILKLDEDQAPNRFVS